MRARQMQFPQADLMTAAVSKTVTCVVDGNIGVLLQNCDTHGLHQHAQSRVCLMSVLVSMGWRHVGDAHLYVKSSIQNWFSMLQT